MLLDVLTILVSRELSNKIRGNQLFYYKVARFLSSTARHKAFYTSLKRLY